MNTVDALVKAALNAAGRPTTFENLERVKAALTPHLASEPELRAEVVRLTRERDELRLAIAGKPMLDGLYHGQYLEMAHTLHAACAGGRERAEAAEHQNAELRAKLAEARAVVDEAHTILCRTPQDKRSKRHCAVIGRARAFRDATSGAKS